MLNRFSDHQKGLLSIIISAILWSSGGIFIKLISLNPIQLSGLRSLIAGLTIILLFKKEVYKINYGTLINGLFYSGILIFFVIATKKTTAANAIFLQYTAPIYVLIFEPLIVKTKFEKINLITIIICFAGMLLFFIGELSPGDLDGNIYALLSGISFSAFLIGLKKNNPIHQPSTIFVGNIFVTLICSYSYFEIQFFNANNFLMILFLGIFQIGLPYAIFSFGLKRVNAIEASLISMIEPVLNPVWVLIGYGEKPAFYSIIGGIIILSGIILKITVFEKRLLFSRR